MAEHHRHDGPLNHKRRKGATIGPGKKKRGKKPKRKGREKAHLYACLEGQESVAGVAHLEDASEAVGSNVSDLEDFEVWRHRAQVELGDDDVVDDDGGFWGLVEGGGQEVAGALVEAGIGREWRPVEVEGHGGGDVVGASFDDG